MSEPLSIVIVGAGFGGIGMAIRLRRAGVRDVTVLEKAGDLGGTWRDNVYPGASCDIPSHLYSFSFERGRDWSRRFPPQEEILDYLRACAAKYGIEPRFGSEVEEAAFDEEHGLWRIRTTAGDELTARALVAACGQLNRPAYPDQPNAFAGPAFHSSRWNHDCDLTGKRVAVVGTGASAIQFVPHVAERAARVHVFQRTPPYVIEKADRPYAPWERRLLRWAPVLRTLSRANLYTRLEARGLGFVTAPRLMRLVERAFRRRLAEQVPDPSLRAALTPAYVMGCKRILLSDDYYAALNRPNVELVTTPIDRFSEQGVITADGREYPVDAVIYGTGFRTQAFVAPMTVRGLGGRTLDEAWRGGAEAYLGIAVSGFPNLFLLYGPNTNLGHNSIIYMLESQFNYIVGCVRALTRARYIDVRADVQNAFNQALQRRFRHTVWTSGCRSWYMTAEGKMVNNWPGHTFAYRRATRRPDPRDFRVRA
ncbi:flavin-containing monooxygenase [Actinoallomurus iriomotensis]|uniref:Flavin-binding monooxygenase n=1 Tax=Actinoallomurus iriomotensis TaxID=478107 RepID=A0A9W6RQT5_9ACTN|nr:NAD(P)/FAD-dependent oxidoreductase [Actinoallomurus iriomotensis]GLY80149.1 flavin-binding monooxygenase [Actinoallomurus iriomotensis]